MRYEAENERALEQDAYDERAISCHIQHLPTGKCAGTIRLVLPKRNGEGLPVEDKFSDSLQDRFERFNDRYLNDEKDFTSQLYKETELVMINNS